MGWQMRRADEGVTVDGTPDARGCEAITTEAHECHDRLSAEDPGQHTACRQARAERLLARMPGALA
jgi:hypothetical protein